MNNLLHLDQETLRAQKAARNMIRRDSIILLILTIAGFVTLVLFNLLFFKAIPLFVALIVYLIFIFLIRLASNWRQWSARKAFQLRCPHCGKLLAERVNLFKSPDRKCPHCGQIALAPLKQLEGVEI